MLSYWSEYPIRSTEIYGPIELKRASEQRSSIGILVNLEQIIQGGQTSDLFSHNEKSFSIK